MADPILVLHLKADAIRSNTGTPEKELVKLVSGTGIESEIQVALPIGTTRLGDRFVLSVNRFEDPQADAGVYR